MAKCEAMIRLIIVMMLFGYIIPSTAQVTPFQHLNTEQGLINSNIHDIDQDIKGYLWFATDNGLSMYDGISFYNFSNNDLGINSFISSIECVGLNRVLFGSGVNGIYEFDILNKKAKKINRTNISQSNKIISVDNLIISLHDYHTIEVLSSERGNLVAVDSIISRVNPNYPLTIEKLRDGTILIGRSDGLYKLNLKSLQQEKIYTSKVSFPVYSISEAANGKLYLGSDNKIFGFYNESPVDTFLLHFDQETRIRNIAADSKGKIWFSLWGGTTIYLYDTKKLVNVGEQSGLTLSGITRFYQDGESNIFVGTMGMGVYYFKNHFIVNYPSQNRTLNSNLRKIIPAKGGLLLGTSDGLAFYDSISDSIKYMKHMPGYSQYVRDICKLDSANYFVAITDLRFKNSLEESFDFEDLFKIRYIHASSLVNDNNGIYYGDWDGKITLLDKEEFNVKSVIDNLPPSESKSKRINAVFRDKYNTIWVGGQFGLCVVDNLLNKKYLIEPLDENPVLSILSRDSITVEVLTNKGLLVYDLTKKVNSIEIIDSIPLRNTTSYAYIGKKSYVFGSTEGLHLINNGFIGKLTVFDGLLSESINDLYYEPHSKVIYVSCSNGLMKMNYYDVLGYFKEEHTIDDIYIETENKRIAKSSDFITLQYYTGAISLIARSLKFSRAKSIRYRIKFDTGEWREVKEGVWRTYSIQPGMYRVQFSAGINNNWGPITKISLKIIPPFYKTAVFYLSLIVALIILSIYIYYIRKTNNFNRLKEAQELQNTLIEYKQKALTSNLNPHFIFNALGSVQSYISKSDSKRANEYINMFANLVRSHINYSDTGFANISSEIDRLKLYLNFEQVRLNNSFTYQIHVSDEIDPTQTHIPTMIIQPFVENAVWHGFSEQTQNGLIRVSFDMQSSGGERVARGRGDILAITIEDNGTGLQQPTTSRHGFTSMGITLVEERLLSLDPSIAQPVSIQELHPGVRVSLRLADGGYRKG